MVRFHAPIARGAGSNPDWGTKIPDASQHAEKKKKALLLCVCADMPMYLHIL